MENNSEKKKYLKTLIGDNIYFSPISLDDIEEYTEMVNDIKVSVGLGSVSYTNITDFESEKEFLTSIKKKCLLLDYLKMMNFWEILDLIH